MSAEKTGWPAPELAQDDHRGLFRWFASKPDARRQVRERVRDICCDHNCDQGRDCPLRLSLHRIPEEVMEEYDPPLTTPEEACKWSLAGLWFLAVVAASCIAGALIAFSTY